MSPSAPIRAQALPATGLTRAGSRGVTLIELVIVTIVIAILASIAIPGYGRLVLKAHRTEAKAALLTVATAQEQFYVQNNRYAADLAAAPPAGLGMPGVTPNGRYVIAVGAEADEASFTATAIAVGPQVRDTQCRSFSIDQAGVKSATHAACWR